jgi:hypothetical protein
MIRPFRRIRSGGNFPDTGGEAIAAVPTTTDPPRYAQANHRGLPERILETQTLTPNIIAVATRSTT